MSVKAPPHKKPNAIDEVVRVLVIYDMLIEASEARVGDYPLAHPERVALLATAERIAARTTDGD